MPSIDPMDELFGPRGGDGADVGFVHSDKAEPKRRSLFEIGEDLSGFDDLLFETGGDVSDPDVEKILDGWFEELQTNLKEKVDNYAAFIKEKEALAEVRRQAARDITELARVDENTASRLKDRLKEFLILKDIKKVETRRYVTGWRNNGGRLPINIDENVDPKELPERFQKVTYEVDTNAVREALDAGEDLEFANYGERGTHLSIR